MQTLCTKCFLSILGCWRLRGIAARTIDLGVAGTELNPFLGWELGADFSSHLLMLALH